MNKLQYLNRKTDNPFKLTDTITLDGVVLVLTSARTFANLSKSKTVLEACVYDSTLSAEETPGLYRAKFEYIFTKEQALVREYYPNNSLKTAYEMEGGTAELLNITDGTTDFRFFEYDNEYTLGVKLTTGALMGMLQLASVDGTSTLGSEWEIPA